jgi:hypothetical protein
MILEGVVTTVSPGGEVNIAPMGPRVEESLRRFTLRPFNTSQTYRNLREHGEGVLHVTDDVLLIAQAAVGKLPPQPLAPAKRVRGEVLIDCCRWFEFRVVSLDDSQERVTIEAEVVERGWVRDFFGFNRAMHAVLEAAILATRTAFLPRDEIDADMRRLAVIVEKTAGPREHAAFQFLREHLQQEQDSPR